ncbi:hypothetical protein E2562_021554 [Oryza meyeriana var. granulata]|uniref:Uncharacterized protein n=1 Tax=Oryza meyeriana var. granulata TaxID=110450 RepID=A0A6G1EXU0_9ORYZ|nr:hypothetical protein E2562_021554 [Oryza meyeriana var. granulata]
MVNTVAQTESNGQVPAREERPARAEVDDESDAVATDPSHPWRHYQIEDGLPPEVEEAIVQDPPPVDEVWTAHTDGAWGTARAGAATIITSPTVRAAAFTARLEFQTTNNMAKYEAILLAL